MSNTLGGAQSILPVTDLRASIDYYVNTLDFKHDWGDAGFASVSRDRCHLFLCENIRGTPERGLGSVRKTPKLSLRNCASAAPKSAIRPPITRGRTKCKWKIPTATYCASAPI